MRTLILVALLLLALRPARAQGIHLDLEYAQASGISLKLDLFVPQGWSTPRPVVVWIHSGAWNTGNKEEARLGAGYLLLRGLAVAAINYRHSYVATFPAQLHDCKAAVRWLRSRAGMFGLDPGRVGAAGSSAGGHLAALLGTTGLTGRLEGDVGGNRHFSSAVMAAVDFYGPTDFFQLPPSSLLPGSPESMLIGKPIGEILAKRNDPAYAAWVALVQDANPATHVTSAAASFHIAHGELDAIVPVGQSRLLEQALRAANVPVVLRVVAGVGHGLPASEADRAFDFLADALMARSGYAPYGQGCSAAGPAPSLDPPPGQWPAIGRTFELELSGLPPLGAPLMALGFSRRAWLGVPLPIGLGPLGWPGCALLAEIAALHPVPLTLAGTGLFKVRIPADPCLADGELFFQGAVVGPGPNDLALTAGGMAVIGK